jgi:hypothetical protein
VEILQNFVAFSEYMNFTCENISGERSSNFLWDIAEAFQTKIEPNQQLRLAYNPSKMPAY